MKKIAEFQEILLLRTFFKLVSQISWDISKLERKYPIEFCNEEELKLIRDAYLRYLEILKANFPNDFNN